MKFKRFISCALVLSMLTSALPLASVPAGAADTTLTPSNTSGTLTITLKIKGNPAAPDAPTKSDVTKNSVTLTTVEGCEYSKDGATWQDSPIFTGLTPLTEYSFYQRKKADDDNNASPASTAAKISTLPDTYSLTITLVIENHEHSWSYTASGATITAECTATTGTCDVTEGLTMTINAPTSLTYDGTAKAATLSTGYNETAFPDDSYPISYFKGTTALNDAPTDAGTYTAKVTAGTATASVDFTIAPKIVTAPTITFSPESYTYDGTAKQPTVTVKDGETTIDASPTITNVADSPLTVYYQVTADNYETLTGSATVTLTKAAQSAPVVSSTNETVAGKEDGTITGVTAAMEYKLSTEDGYTPVANGATKIEGLAAGTYNVRYAADANHEASPAADVIINTGSKITVQFNADGGTPEPAAQQFTYGQKVSKPETDPTKTGYTFKFWSADGETEYDFSTELTANITLNDD